MRRNPVMRPLILALSLSLVAAGSALAGAPLKGIDVKLGKNPGGGCANRTTGADGVADFGIWPKGNYTIAVAPGPTGAHLAIAGAAGGAIERDVGTGAADRAAPIGFALDGAHPLRVVVTAARSKAVSHSNTNNN